LFAFKTGANDRQRLHHLSILRDKSESLTQYEVHFTAGHRHPRESGVQATAAALPPWIPAFAGKVNNLLKYDDSCRVRL
jgi:hypothetical protein